MVKRNFVLIGLLFLLSISSSSAFTGDGQSVNEQITQAIKAEELTGIVWSTFNAEQVVTGSAGFSDAVSNNPMTQSNKVHVGSVTKTVLSFGVLRLISQGKLKLATEIAPLLPELTINNPYKDNAPITVKHLLEHTAGLDNLRMWQFLNSQPTPNTPLKDAFPKNNTQLLTVRSKPGSQYSYSNMGYSLLGMVIEAVTANRYEEYLNQELLRPLGMFDSTFSFVSQVGEYQDERLAMGHFENSAQQSAVPMYLRPAGQFTTTAPDMVKIIRFALSNGELNNQPFIKSELMAQLSYPNQTDADNAGLKIGHGLALAVRDRHGVISMCHPGTTVGFRAYLCIYPEEKKGFFYAINTDSETANYEKFNQFFIKHLAIKNASEVNVNNKIKNLAQYEGIYVPAPNNMAEFEWLDLVFNFKWLTVEDDRLIVKSLQNDDRELLPITKSLLRATDRTQGSHVIYTGEDQAKYLSNGLSTYKQQSSFIVTYYWLSLILGLLGLFYIVVIALFRLAKGKHQSAKPLLWPLITLLALSIPIYLFTTQSLFEFGELTAASGLLAMITGLLPISLIVSLLMLYRTKLANAGEKRDFFALLMLLQLCTVLIYWQQLPAIFWR